MRGVVFLCRELAFHIYSTLQTMANVSDSDSDVPEFTPLKDSSPTYEDDEVVNVDSEFLLCESAPDSQEIPVTAGKSEETELQESIQQKQRKQRTVETALNQANSKLLWLKADKAEQMEKLKGLEGLVKLKSQLQAISAQVQYMRNQLTTAAVVPQSVLSWKNRIELLASTCISDSVHLLRLKSRLSEWQHGRYKRLAQWLCSLLLGILLGVVLKRLSANIRH